MEYDFTSNLGWDKRASLTQNLDMKMDLGLEKIFQSRHDVQRELAKNEAGIRSEIFGIAVNKIVPKVLQSSGSVHHLPEGDIDTRSHINISNTYNVSGNRMQNSLDLHIDVASNRRINGIQAFNAVRGGLADAIATNVVHSLKATLFGVTESKNNNEWELDHNRVKKYGSAPVEA